MHKVLTEFVGNLLFLFAIGCAVASGSPLAALAIGGALACLVYMGGHVSGAHYNPAISLAAVLAGKMPRADFLPYVVAQCLGSAAGCWLATLATGKSFAPAPGAGVGAMPAIVVETVFTGMLALVVLNVATAKSNAGNSFYGLAIGGTIVVAAIAGGPVSGGAFNPAVAIGSTVVHAVTAGAGFGHLWLYFAGPLAGGALAAVIFRAQTGE